MTHSISPPSRLALLGEVRGALEPARLLLRAPLLAAVPRGHGEQVLLLPGFGAGDASTTVLQSFLRLIGYQARGWGLGRNTGNVARLMPSVLALVQAMVEAGGGPVHLLGWSLGGYIAREAAREKPEWIRSVITMGSPVIGGPKYTTVAARYRRQGHDLDHLERMVDARYDNPLTTPVTAIFSKADGVVAWEACIDRRSNGIEHVEVKATHIGLGFSPEVYAIVADRLSRHSGPAPGDRPRPAFV